MKSYINVENPHGVGCCYQSFVLQKSENGRNIHQNVDNQKNANDIGISNEMAFQMKEI